MAKNGGKLGKKLKCMIKRWHSSSRIATGSAAAASAACMSSPEEDDGKWQHSSSFHGDEVPAGSHPVYVGKSRRRYLVSADLLDHPLFQVLVERSGSGDAERAKGGPTVVGCEVVLFEHLLWMLENADPQPESLDELVEFYAC